MMSLNEMRFLKPYSFCNVQDEIDFFQGTRNRQMELSLFVYQHSSVNHFHNMREQNEKWPKQKLNNP